MTHPTDGPVDPDESDGETRGGTDVETDDGTDVETDDGTEDETDVESPVLAAARQAYVARPVTAPADLLGRTMDTVGRELRPARRLPITTPPDVRVRGVVTDIAAANALRRALDDDPAVIARRCRVEPPGRHDPGWRVSLTVAVSFAHYDHHGEREVRRRVVAAADRLFGATITAVDIDVVDVFPGGGEA